MSPIFTQGMVPSFQYSATERLGVPPEHISHSSPSFTFLSDKLGFVSHSGHLRAFCAVPRGFPSSACSNHQIGEDFLSRWIFNTFVLCFRVLVEAEIVIVFHNFALRHQKALISTGALVLRVRGFPIARECRECRCASRPNRACRRACIRRLHVVEPNLVRAACVRLRKHENSGTYA